LELTIVK